MTRASASARSPASRARARSSSSASADRGEGSLTSSLSVAVIGATGYTGVELLRLLLAHPHVRVTRVVGQSKAGEPIAKALPSLAGVLTGDIAAFDADDIAANAKVAFSALPHGASAPVVKALRDRGVVVLDLSADFRLHDVATHREWYGDDHAPELRAQAVYGLPELYRRELRTADLIAVPGCFPTASILALAPLLGAARFTHGGVDAQPIIHGGGHIIIDAKSGVSGAGRAPVPSTHFSETSEGVRAYKSAGQHRHIPEIEQELSRLYGSDGLYVTFTPHLVPMTRGLLATAYATLRHGLPVGRDAAATQAPHVAATCTQAARELYADSPSVVVLEPGSHPDTLWVRGSARAMVSYAVDARSPFGIVIAQCAIDNLGKGAAGQAVQCLNLRFGFAENAGLPVAAMFP